MRSMDHNARDAWCSGDNSVSIVRACGRWQVLGISAGDAIDAFTAHVIGEMVIGEARQRPLRRSELVRGLEANHGRRWWRRGRAL